MVLLSRRHYFDQPTSTKATSVQNHFANSILLYYWTQFQVVIENFPKHPHFLQKLDSQIRVFFFLLFISFLSIIEHTTVCCRTHTGVIIVFSSSHSSVWIKGPGEAADCWNKRRRGLIYWADVFFRGFQATPLVPHSLHFLLFLLIIFLLRSRWNTKAAHPQHKSLWQ